MDCVAVMAASSALVFAKLAEAQDLNPFLWGPLAAFVYAAVPAWLIWRGASIWQAPLVWISPLGGLVGLFIVQAFVAHRARRRRR